jgi:hypothetical protein
MAYGFGEKVVSVAKQVAGTKIRGRSGANILLRFIQSLFYYKI